MHTITQGWSNTIKEVPCSVQAYWTIREKPMVADGLVLQGTRITMPKNKHHQLLQMIQ